MRAKAGAKGAYQSSVDTRDFVKFYGLFVEYTNCAWSNFYYRLSVVRLQVWYAAHYAEHIGVKTHLVSEADQEGKLTTASIRVLEHLKPLKVLDLAPKSLKVFKIYL